MFLNGTRKTRQLGRSLVAAASLLLASAGCKTTPEPSLADQRQKQQMDWMDQQSRQAASQNAAPGPSTVRSQTPQIEQPPQPGQPTIVPVTNITMNDAKPDSMPAQGETQVRIVATIGTTPIYDREVREAVYQHSELFRLPPFERKAKEKEMYKQELRKLVERELILDELFAMLKDKKQASALKGLKDSAAKEADNRMREIQKTYKIPNEEVLKEFLQAQGLTMAGMRRHFERGFMMQVFLSERLKARVNSIGLYEIRDYYDEHPEEFQTVDSVKWQNLFVRIDRFQSREQAKKYAEDLMNRARGEEFAKLIEFDQGDSKSRDGFGFGEAKGKINPPELETTILAMKPGEVTMVDFGSGFHIVRIAERNYAGRRPYNDKVQDDIRKKLSGLISEREYYRIVDTLWRKSQPQLLAD